MSRKTKKNTKTKIIKNIPKSQKITGKQENVKQITQIQGKQQNDFKK